MARLSPKAERLKMKYAPLLGGKDVNGVIHPDVPDEKRKREIFAVKNVEMENGHWTFVGGHVINGLIANDIYEVDYIGNQRHFVDPGDSNSPDESDLTKEEKAFRKKYQDYARRMVEDVNNQEVVNAEKAGYTIRRPAAEAKEAV